MSGLAGHGRDEPNMNPKLEDLRLEPVSALVDAGGTGRRSHCVEEAPLY